MGQRRRKENYRVKITSARDKELFDGYVTTNAKDVKWRKVAKG